MRPIQCPICNQSFNKASERDRHLRQQICRPKAGPIRGSLDTDREGIDAHQLALLRGRPRRGLTEAERWYAIWDVLFPSAPQPDSPYITSPEDEILNIARRSMKLVFPHGTTSSQVLDRLDWSTVSSTLENNQLEDPPPSKPDSLSSVDFLTPQQPGDVEPSLTTAMPSVSTQAGSEKVQSSSNSIPALRWETPTTSVFSLDFEVMTPCTTQEEEPFFRVPSYVIGDYDEASDVLQIQGETVGLKEWCSDHLWDDVQDFEPWGTIGLEPDWLNTFLMPEHAGPLTTTVPPVPPPAIDSSTILPLQIPPTFPEMTQMVADDQIANTEEELAIGSIWDKAYNALQTGEPEHIATYENPSAKTPAKGPFSNPAWTSFLNADLRQHRPDKDANHTGRGKRRRCSPGPHFTRRGCTSREGGDDHGTWPKAFEPKRNQHGAVGAWGCAARRCGRHWRSC